MKSLNIKTIRIDGGTQSRAEINNEIVTEYADAIKAGTEFPAVVVFNDGAHNWLADGFHRFHAHNQAGKASISADVRTGTARDAVLYSLGANGTHGLRRTNADKHKAVQIMLADAEWAKWSDRKIAEACEVTHPFVASIRTPKVVTVTTPPAKSSPTKATEKPSKSTPKPEVATAKTPLTVVAPVIPPEDQYTELDAKNDQIADLQSMLAVANLGTVSEEDKDQAKNLIAELRAEIKTLRATLKAVTQSRDSLMNELAQVKRQCIAQQRELKSFKGNKAA